MSAASGKRLGKVLVQSGLITPEQLEEALAQDSGLSLPAALSSLGYADDVKIAQEVARAMGLVYVDIGTFDIDANAATSLSSDMAKRYTILPIKVQDGELVVAMADPANIFAIDDLRIVTGYEIRPVVAAESELLSAIERFSANQQNVDDMVGNLEESVTVSADDDDSDISDETAPVAKLMNVIITEAIRQGAGDVYIEPLEKEMRVRFRIDGVCQEVFKSPKRMHRQLISRLKISSGMDIAEKRIPQDGRFGVVLDGKSIDFRVAVLPLVHGELAVMR
ncbi:MAG: ATPase, T2SS/T4P/T4SS family, partial [Actinomycetota bacterium]|nr:ATPase, T2SS/T4P/T4SS family [Actinomycetota bacterium]